MDVWSQIQIQNLKYCSSINTTEKRQSCDKMRSLLQEGTGGCDQASELSVWGQAFKTNPPVPRSAIQNTQQETRNVQS